AVPGDRPRPGVRADAHRCRRRRVRRGDPGDRGRGRRGRRDRRGRVMTRCAECSVAVEGTWVDCPLCGARLEGEACGDPFPAVTLEFSRRRVLRTLFLASLAVIALSFAAQLLFNRDGDGIGVLRSLWMGVAAMWLV